MQNSTFPGFSHCIVRKMSTTLRTYCIYTDLMIDNTLLFTLRYHWRDWRRKSRSKLLRIRLHTATCICNSGCDTLIINAQQHHSGCHAAFLLTSWRLTAKHQPSKEYLFSVHSQLQGWWRIIPVARLLNDFNPCLISASVHWPQYPKSSTHVESRLCRRNAEMMPIRIPSGSMEYCNGVHGPRANETLQAVNWIRAFQDNTQSRSFYHSPWRSGYSTCQYPGYGVSLSLSKAVVYLMETIGIWHMLIYHFVWSIL